MKTVSVLHPSHARGRTTRRRFSVLAVVVAIVGSLFAGVTAASAATTGAVGAGISIYPAGYGEVWLGGHTPPAGGDAVLYCTQARVYTSAGDVPLGTSYMADDPALAWVISAYGNSGDNDTQAAIAYLVHMRHEIPGSMAGGNVATVKQLISTFGFTAQQVFPWKPEEKKRVEAKYYDPESGATWTGRGKPPKWIEGKNRDLYTIKQTDNPFPVE